MTAVMSSSWLGDGVCEEVVNYHVKEVRAQHRAGRRLCVCADSWGGCARGCVRVRPRVWLACPVIAPPRLLPDPQDTTLLNVLGSSFLFVSVMLLLWRLGRQYGASYSKANTLSLGVDTSNLSVCMRRAAVMDLSACQWAPMRCLRARELGVRVYLSAAVRAAEMALRARARRRAGCPCILPLLPVRGALLRAAGD